ncbi:MAG TPA: DUF1501 domain-containing protein [Gemmataceae bacterium]|nr:DUF1501 domain-containing protein [Gemmataceae bacterium]
MFTLLGPSQRFCDGITRRNFLRIGAFGAGLTLADMLRLRATAGTAKSSAKAAIMIQLGGGPSHIDMYDLKPEAPLEYRGEFKPIATNVPGVQICEHFPLQARLWDKFAVIRSLIGGPEHSDSQTHTGYTEQENRTAHHPSLGAVVSKLRGSQDSDIPPFVSLRGMGAGTEPGFLGVAHRPFTPDGPGLQNLRLPGGVDATRAEDRKALLTSFDDVRRDLDASGTMRGMDSFKSRAFDMVASGAVRKALDLSREDPRSRDRYKGVEQFLTARRLVEAGVGCVTLSYGGWDTHAENFKTLRRQLPPLDVALSNLIQDLHDRGMEKDVVTVMWGEFGRTPKVGDSTPDGRGHWPPVMSALVAGGGLKMGQAIGTSSPRAEVPKDRPYRVSQVLSTIYHALGIDPAQTFPNGSGRPMYVLDDREPVTELL